MEIINLWRLDDLSINAISRMKFDIKIKGGRYVNRKLSVGAVFNVISNYKKEREQRRLLNNG